MIVVPWSPSLNVCQAPSESPWTLDLWCHMSPPQLGGIDTCGPGVHTSWSCLLLHVLLLNCTSIPLSAKQRLLISVCSCAVCSLSLEQDRRLVEQRNEALNHLFHDIQDLNHLARDLAEVVYDREDRINKIGN